MKNAIKPLAKSGLTAAALAADAETHQKILGSGGTATLITLNYEMENIIKIVKSLGDSGLSLKGVTETIQNEATEQKGGFPRMLLGTLGASLLGNMLAGKRINREDKDFLEQNTDLKDL